ncbi:MAG: hypothetical protein ACI4HQ_08060 [Acetatifactor sp.]
MKKSKHTGLKIFLAILLILIVLLAILGIRLYRVWKDAKYMEEKADWQHFTYEVELELDKDHLSSSLTDTLDALAEVSGLSEAEVYNLRITGTIYGDVIHAVIYPCSSDTPLTDLYLGSDGNVINGATIYNVMRKEFVEGNEQLEALLPEWKGHEYMTAEQIGRMLEANLKDVSGLSLNTEDIRLTAKEYFLALAIMGREKGRYRLNFMDDLTAEVNLKEEAVTVNLEVKNPDQVIKNLSSKLSFIGVDIKTDKLEMADRISVEISFEEGKKMKMPGDIVSDKDLEAVIGVRTLIRKYTGR